MSRALRKAEEVKEFDTNVTSTASDYSATLSHFALFDVVQGSASNQRIGDNARIRSIAVRGRLDYGTSPNSLRVICYQWNDMSTGSSPVPSDLLTQISTTNAPFSTFKQAIAGRITVIWDRTFMLSTNDKPAVNFAFLFTGSKFFKRDVHWTPGSSTLKKNGIYLLFVSDDGAVPYPTVQFQARIRYSDA